MTESAAFSGAKQILKRCLGLTKGQNLLIFADKTTGDLASLIAEVAQDLGIQPTIIFVPISLQRRIPHEIDLSLLAQGAAKEARAILNCVNPSAECLPFRKRVLETQWSARTRIGHMPGASPEVLSLANVDINRLSADCHRLEIALGRGRQLEFISRAHDGAEHHLTADIGGWDRLAVPSDGIIADGVWGNVPSGETYIAPIEGRAEGSIVINGSMPGLVVKSSEQLVLHFERGRLTRMEPETNATAVHLQVTQIDRARKKGDENWRNLAEIGIGLNRSVGSLTGNMLFDEKAQRTAHIALGTNTFMGGKIDSVIHCDMVIQAPTIIVDGKTILERGELRYAEDDWREDCEDVLLAASPFLTAEFVTRSGVEAASHNQQLSRILRPEPGRVSTCFIGNDQTSRLAHILYHFMPNHNQWIKIDDLVNATTLESSIVRRVLHIVWEYGLINYC